MEMMIFFGLWVLAVIINYSFVSWYDTKKERTKSMEPELAVAFTLLPVFNLIFSLMIAYYLVADKLEVVYGKIKGKYRKKKTEMKEIKLKKNERDRLEALKKESGVFLYIHNILECMEKQRRNVDSNQRETFEKIEGLLSEAVDKLEKNKDESEFQKVMMQYEEVFKSVYEAMQHTIKIKESLTLEITEEVLDICLSFKESLAEQEEEIMKNIKKKLQFEKNYLEKIGSR